MNGRFLISCILFACASMCAQADRVSHFYSKQGLYHVNGASDNVASLSAVSQIALDSLGLPAIVDASHMEGNAGIASDLFEKPAAFAMVYVAGGADDETSAAIKSLEYSEAAELVAEEGISQALFSVASYAVYSGKVVSDEEPAADVVDAAWREFPSFQRENPADAAFVMEWAAAKSMLSQVNEATTLYPVLFHSMSELQSSKQAIAKKALGEYLNEFGQTLKRVHGDVAMQVVTTQTASKYDSRRLQEATEAPTPTGTVNSTNNNTTYVNFGDIEGYQVALWTAVGLGLTLFSAIVCLCTMDVGRDSLLYAKFRTDGSHRKID